MKAFPLLTLVLLLLTACDFDIFPDPEPPPPPVLPPITQTGENTLGFLLDGEVWVPNRIFQGDYLDGKFGISCEHRTFDTDGNDVGQSISMGSSTPFLFSEGEFLFQSRPNLAFWFNDRDQNCKYYSSEELGGKLFITRFDSVNRITSGTFYLRVFNSDCNDTLNITNGRFDIKF